MQKRNQLNAMKDILTRAGCTYTLKDDGEIILVVDAVSGPAVGGIEGASVEFRFSREGDLVCVSPWGPVAA